MAAWTQRAGTITPVNSSVVITGWVAVGIGLCVGVEEKVGMGVGCHSLGLAVGRICAGFVVAAPVGDTITGVF
jgi:hypothetical protein